MLGLWYILNEEIILPFLMLYGITIKKEEDFLMEKIKEFFKLEERNTNIKTEVLAGLTTFLAMAYILPVNMNILGTAGVPAGGVFFATALASAVACLIMGLVANYPVALAPGMGINAFFTYNVVLADNSIGWRGALAAVLISGILFLIVSVTGIRRKVINAVPQGLKYSVGAGIGFFITFIGLKNMGIISRDLATLVSLNEDGLSNPAVLLGLFGLVVVVILYAMGNKFALIISIVTTAVVGVILGLIGVNFMPELTTDSVGFFEDVGKTIFAPFRGGFVELFNSPSALFIIFVFLFVDFFDTAGTLMAVGNQAGLINEDSELVGGDRALLADAIGTIGGSFLGTSTVTSYIESSTGIEQGGRTGLTAVTVGILFLLSLLLYPFMNVFLGVFIGLDPITNAAIVYSPVTAMALVMVGALMVTQLKNIEWDDKAILVPAFLTIVFMIFTFSIAEGIAVGFVFYPIIMVFTKRAKEVNPIMYILMAVFILFFVLKGLGLS